MMIRYGRSKGISFLSSGERITDEEFRRAFRMSRNIFESLISILRSWERLGAQKYRFVKVRLLATLSILGDKVRSFLIFPMN